MPRPKWELVSTSKSSEPIEKVVKEYTKVLRDFNIDIKPAVENEIRNRYPSTVSIERYVKELISQKLNT